MKYITDLIGDEYLNWTNQHVLISSPTGSGKTTFILKKLLPRAIEQGKYILYLCNRKILNAQFKEDSSAAFQEIFPDLEENKLTQEQRRHIIILTYQSLEAKKYFYKRLYISPDLSKFTKKQIKEIKSRCGLIKSEAIEWSEILYFIYDEAHYFLTDSAFNKNCNLWYDRIYQYPMCWLRQPEGTHIYLTATPEPFKVFMASHIKETFLLNRKPEDFNFYEWIEWLYKARNPKKDFEEHHPEAPMVFSLLSDKIQEASKYSDKRAAEKINQAYCLMQEAEKYMSDAEIKFMFKTGKRLYDIYFNVETKYSFNTYIDFMNDSFIIPRDFLIGQLYSKCSNYYHFCFDKQRYKYNMKQWNTVVDELYYECMIYFYYYWNHPSFCRFPVNEQNIAVNLYYQCLEYCQVYEKTKTQVFGWNKMAYALYNKSAYYNMYCFNYPDASKCYTFYWKDMINSLFYSYYKALSYQECRSKAYTLLQQADSLIPELKIIHGILDIYNEDFYRLNKIFIKEIEEKIKNSMEIFYFKEYSFGNQFLYQNMKTTYFRKILDLYPIICEEVERTKQTGSLEKWLIFVNNENDGTVLCSMLNYNHIQAVFMTAKNIKQSSSKKEMKSITAHKKFNCDVLIATSVIDCGVSIHDSSVKNIVLSHSNKTTFLQMLGRKRLQDYEQIHLYLRMFSRASINGICHQYEEKVRFMVNYIYCKYNSEKVTSSKLRKVEMKEQNNEYSRLLFTYNDNMQNYEEVNPGNSVFIYYIYLIIQYRRVLNDSPNDPLCYLKEQLFWLGQTYSEYNWLNYEKVQAQIQEILAQYTDKKKNTMIIKSDIVIQDGDYAVSVKDFIVSLSEIFKQDQLYTSSLEKFFSAVKKGSVPTISTLNKILDEREIPYTIKSKRTTFHKKQVSIWEVMEK